MVHRQVMFFPCWPPAPSGDTRTNTPRGVPPHRIAYFSNTTASCSSVTYKKQPCYHIYPRSQVCIHCIVRAASPSHVSV